MSFENFTTLIKRRKMNFIYFSWEKFWKLRNGFNDVGEFGYDTICSQNFVSITSGLEIFSGGQNFTDTHTHTHTHTHTPRSFCKSCFLRESRNKVKKQDSWKDLCFRVCVCVRARARVCVCVCVFVFAYLCEILYAFEFVFACAFLSAFMWKFECILCAGLFERLFACCALVSMRVCASVCACIYVWVCGRQLI